MKPSTRKWRKRRNSKWNPWTHVTMSQCCDWLFTCHVTFSKTRTLWLAFVRSGHPGGPKVPPGGLWLNQVPPVGLNSINLITETIFDENLCLKRKNCWLRVRFDGIGHEVTCQCFVRRNRRSAGGSPTFRSPIGVDRPVRTVRHSSMS